MGPLQALIDHLKNTFSNEASVNNLRQFPQQLLALHQLIQQHNAEQDLKMYPGLSSPNPAIRQQAQMQRMLNNTAVGASMGSDMSNASWAVPSGPARYPIQGAGFDKMIPDTRGANQLPIEEAV